MVMCYENDYSNLEKPRRQTSYTYGNYVDSNKLNIIHNDFHAKSWQGRYAKEFQF